MMNEMLREVDSIQEIKAEANRLRHVAMEKPVTVGATLDIFEAWANALQGGDLDILPGAPFLRLWLRRGTLDPILRRELGSDWVEGKWHNDGYARLRAFPVGVIGHWPAGNIEIQPVLSLTCALLGGNSCIVRIPSGLLEISSRIMEKLVQVDKAGVLTERIFMAAFDRGRLDLHSAMAEAVDGAMIWGGDEAVTQIRSLPFPNWARLAVFGPRLSIAAMDAGTWGDQRERFSWCQRLARDVWQFEQKACSSPQVLFLEKSSRHDLMDFVKSLQNAFDEENRVHPRLIADSALTSAICRARTSWLLDDVAHRAFFPKTPDWTILLGEGSIIPNPTQGRTLNVLLVDDLFEPIRKFDGNVQTLGLGMSDPASEEALATAAANRGVDRIVKIGRMHVFSSPWDGTNLIHPMVRLVRYIPSQN
jgi:hypothetical protein